jgi:peptide/nickel transport system substrate-binding protein
MRPMRRIAWLLLVVSSLLAACRRETVQPPTQTAVTQTVEAGPRVGGRLVRRLESDINTLNYVLHTTEDERQVLQYVYDPLIDFNAELEPIPGTAARWEIADGGKTYVLYLDPRAVFSDGKPVTAADVIFTLEKILDEESVQYGAWFAGLDREQTKAIDERTVRVVFKEPRVSQLMAFNIGVLPQHVYGKGKFESVRAVIGNGPYVVQRRERGKSVLLARNEKYWRDKPPIDTVLFRVIADDTQALNALKRGDLHVVRLNNDVWAREKDDPKLAERVTFHNSYQFMYNCVPWNLRDPLFAEAQVRRALAMAFDRQSVIERLYHGNARATSGPFTPDVWAYNQNVNPIEYNLEGAAALLGSAGWKDTDQDGVLDRDGKKFAFTMLIAAGSSTSVAQSQIYQDALKKIGVDMTISNVDGAAFFDRMVKGEFQAALMAWTNDPDPDLFSLFHSSQAPPAGLNINHYKNAEVDELLERGRREFDRARRTEIYHQLHEIVAADQPYLFMVQVGLKWAVDKRVQNVRVAKGVGLFLWHPGPLGWWMKEP